MVGCSPGSSALGPGLFTPGGVSWRFVEGTRGRPPTYTEPRVRTQVQLTPPVAGRLQAWARRHEVSVTRAVELALIDYLPGRHEPPVRTTPATAVVRIRVPFGLHRQLAAEADRARTSLSRVAEGAVVALVAGEGLQSFR